MENRPDFSLHIETQSQDGEVRRFLSLVNRHRLPKVLRYMLDEKEFLSPYGVRALSRYHKDHPYVFSMMGMTIASNTSRRNPRPVSSGGIRIGGGRYGFR